jgi:hypothetical protein
MRESQMALLPDQEQATERPAAAAPGPKRPDDYLLPRNQWAAHWRNAPHVSPGPLTGTWQRSNGERRRKR